METSNSFTSERASIRAGFPVSTLEPEQPMSDEPITSDEFRSEVEEAASILRQHGFQHIPQFDSESPTTASVVYVGRNIAFTFTLDIRDQGIDLVVTQYCDGKLMANLDGGYSSSLSTHLLKHCGFRGRLIPSASLPSTASKAKRMLSALMNLLAQPCSASLLEDRPDSLSQKPPEIR